MGIFSKLFGAKPKVNFNDMVANGAQIIDVRTPSEFNSGHIKNAVNMPLQSFPNSLKKIKKGKPIITCCASGMRSAAAKNILLKNGFTEVYNGGGWMSLERKINNSK